MKVKIIAATPNPINVISLAAGTSYGRNNISKKRIKTCVDNGHMSVLEHVCATFKISGISRSCTHQLVRHRLASFTEKSLRYTKPETDNDDWYVVPPDIMNNNDAMYEYKYLMANAASQYKTMVSIFGIKPEDARFLLPLATKTEITVTMNLREFFHFYDLRSAKDAQWEIREMAIEMFNALKDVAYDWKWLLDLYSNKKNLEKQNTLRFADAQGLAFASQ